MNASFGLLPALSGTARGRARKELMVARALSDQERWIADISDQPMRRPINAA
jgi:hypothetical protein